MSKGEGLESLDSGLIAIRINWSVKKMSELREGALVDAVADNCWAMTDGAGTTETLNHKPTKEEALAFKDRCGITAADVRIDNGARTVTVRRKDVSGGDTWVEVA